MVSPGAVTRESGRRGPPADDGARAGRAGGPPRPAARGRLRACGAGAGPDAWRRRPARPRRVPSRAARAPAAPARRDGPPVTVTATGCARPSGLSARPGPARPGGNGARGGGPDGEVEDPPLSESRIIRAIHPPFTPIEGGWRGGDAQPGERAGPGPARRREGGRGAAAGRRRRRPAPPRLSSRRRAQPAGRRGPAGWPAPSGPAWPGRIGPGRRRAPGGSRARARGGGERPPAVAVGGGGRGGTRGDELRPDRLPRAAATAVRARDRRGGAGASRGPAGGDVLGTC
jgi:hypothetical protein